MFLEKFSIHKKNVFHVLRQKKRFLKVSVKIKSQQIFSEKLDNCQQIYCIDLHQVDTEIKCM